jgi:transporter family protein
MLAQGTSDFVYKRAQDRGIVLESYLAVECGPFGATALLFGFLLGDLYINGPTVVFGLLAGVISFWSIFFFVTSLREGEVGVLTLIFRLNFVVVAIMAIFWLGESWTTSLGIGLLCAVLAIASVTLLERTSRKGKTNPGRSIGLALLAMVLFAILNLLFKIGIQEGANVAWMVVFASLSWFPSAVLVVVLRRRFSMPKSNWIFLPITGFLKSSAFFALLYAFQRGGSASVVVPITQLSFLVTIVWAAVVLREPLTRPKLIGLAFAVAAIVAFSAQAG